MTTNTNLLPSHQAAVVEVIDPDAYAASAVNSGWVSLIDFAAIQTILMLGAMVATALADLKLQQATDAAGSGVKDIAGKAITQMTAAGSDDDKQAIINCRADELDVDGGFTHVRAVMTLTTAGSDAGAIILGHYPHYGPASDNDLASVDEIIA